MMAAAAENHPAGMLSTRIATWLAIAAGGLIGAAAAMMGHSAAPPPPPARPAATTPAATGAETAPRSDAEAGSLDAARKTAPSHPAMRYAPPLPARPAAVKRAALHCAWGHIEPCLQTAAAYRTGSGVDTEPGEAKLYEHRARELAIDLCEEGHAEACYALAYMYQHGISMPARPDKVPGLIRRVRMLCHIRATPICRRVVTAPDGG